MIFCGSDMQKTHRSGLITGRGQRLTYRSKAFLTTSDTVSSRSVALSSAAAQRSSGMRMARGVSGILATCTDMTIQQRIDNNPLAHVTKTATLSQPMMPKLLAFISVRKSNSTQSPFRLGIASGEYVKSTFTIPAIDLKCIQGLDCLHVVSSRCCLYIQNRPACIYMSSAFAKKLFGRVA